MSAPLIVPKGSDRSWTRGFYHAINKVFRRMWYEQHMDDQVSKAAVDCMVKGRGYVRVRYSNHNEVQRATTGED